MAYTPSLSPELYTDANSSIDAHFQNMMRQQDITPIALDTNKPRFTLVVGPSPFSMPRGWEFFLTAPYEGVTYISTVLSNAGYPIRIIDVRYDPTPMQTALEQIKQGTDVLGLATFEDNFPWCRELMQMVRDDAPNMPIICGGSLVTSVPHIFMNHSACDIAVISEGEITILELMESYTRGRWQQDLPNIRGIWYRNTEGQAVATLPRGQVMDLDSLPRMNLGLWPQAQSEMGMQPQIISSYSRGCKMDCSFCYRTTPQERSKSPEKMDRDMAYLKDNWGVDFVFFVDLTFTSHKKQTLDILDVIKQHDVRWTCLTRCTDVDKERADAMRESGCDIALYGVESLGKEVLKEARKGSSENLTIKAQRTTEEAGIRFGALTIVGLPAETEESLDHMCQWAEEFNHVTRVKYLSAMPGTTVYKSGIDEGYLKSEIDHLNWLSIEQALVEDEFINYTSMPENKMREGYRRLYEAYQPGPVMDFEHWPEHFAYFHPNMENGKNSSTDYAGGGWRAEFSSAAGHLAPGSERFILQQTGVPGSVEKGASQMPCGAAIMQGSAK